MKNFRYCRNVLLLHKFCCVVLVSLSVYVILIVLLSPCYSPLRSGEIQSKVWCPQTLLLSAYPLTLLSLGSSRMAPQRTLKIEQFRPSFSDSELAGLKQTLERSRLPARTYAMDQAEYGITYDYMKEALDRWKNGFDWYVSLDEVTERVEVIC